MGALPSRNLQGLLCIPFIQNEVCYSPTEKITTKWISHFSDLSSVIPRSSFQMSAVQRQCLLGETGASNSIFTPTRNRRDIRDFSFSLTLHIQSVILHQKFYLLDLSSLNTCLHSHCHCLKQGFITHLQYFKCVLAHRPGFSLIQHLTVLRTIS